MPIGGVMSRRATPAKPRNAPGLCCGIAVNPNDRTRQTTRGAASVEACDHPDVGQWTFDPLPLVGGAVALVLYAQGFQRLRARNKSLVGWGRAALYALGVVIGVLALVSPIDTIGE